MIDGRRRNLDLRVSTEFAADDRGEHPHGAMHVQIGQQGLEIGARLPQPASQAFADHGALGADLHQIQERLVGVGNDSGGVERDKSIRQEIDQPLDRGQHTVATFHRHGRRGELQQKDMAGFGCDQRSPEHPRFGIGAEMHQDAERLAALADTGQHIPYGLAIVRGDFMQQFPPG